MIARLLVVVVGLTAAAVTTVALTATNTVAGGRMGELGAAITANDLKPPDCATLTLTGIQLRGGGSGGNALILGSDLDDRIVGGSGDDCIVGGAGDDVLTGNSGRDVCIGGPGVDVFHRSCETQIQ